MRAEILYIATFLFVLGLLLLILGTSLNSIGILVIGGYFTISAIICAVIVTIVEPRIRPKKTPEEKRRLTVISEEQEEV